LSDGSWYFHIRAFDGEYIGGTEGVSETVHVGPFIIDTQPSISSVNPNKGSAGTSVTITGTSVMDDATVKIGTTNVDEVEFVSSKELTITIPSSGLSSGAVYGITVTNPSAGSTGKSVTKSNCFTVSSDNSSPVVEAGSKKTVIAGNAPNFSDATATDADEDEMTYTWSLVSAPSGATAGTDYTLSAPNSLNGVTFTPTTSGAYSLKLTATDSDGAKGSDTVWVRVDTDENTTPEANAGNDQSVKVGDQVNLKGTKTDPDTGDSWNYAWTLTPASGSSATLTGSDTATPSFTPDKAGAYSISFVVTDAAGVASVPDTLTVTVYNSGDLNADGEVTLGDAIVGLQVLVGMEVSINNPVAFATGEQVSLAEIIYILNALLTEET
jgi:hypothetical protein